MDIKSPKLDELIYKIEEIKRRKIIDYKDISNLNYVDVNNNLRKLKIYNNHLIYGRRGSGKTTLMMKALNESSLLKNIDVIVDAQILKSDSDLDIVIQLIEKILNRLIESLNEEEDIELANAYKKETKSFKGIIKKIFKKQEKSILHRFEEYQELIYVLGILGNSLRILKTQPEQITLTISKQDSTENTTNKTKIKKFNSNTTIENSNDLGYGYQKIKSTLKTLSSINISMENSVEIRSSNQQTTGVTATGSKTITKAELLRDIKDSIIELISKYYQYKSRHIILILDDFYQIPLEKHPYIIQYFHDIYKNCSSSAFCFKVCSLPNRLRMNEKGNGDFSHKDDFSPINLDNDLSSLERVRDHLISILLNIDVDLGLTRQDIISLFTNDETLLYAVIAAGGNPRDFLIIFMELVRSTRGEDKQKVQKSNVYSVIKQLKDDKDSTLEDDSDINPEIVRQAITTLEAEIVNKRNTNVFLYPMEKSKEHEPLLKNLVNLRYLHLIKDSTSSETKKKEEFVAYLIDMSFYVSEKSIKRGFNFRPFWQKDSEARLTHLRNAPIFQFSDELVNQKQLELVK
ncbi:hypothetical protein [Bacillus sp. B-jedd]|uniref:hypothetical protein n=1 Tax=Bacillus sp. B-jedd TaxID=1476857 RepID=UPI0005156862|nr:hypothetical protein [Bacillus sp. B-jedd]CEG02205.1 hypothetical protein BN1002_04782 [Bacillus sp. B-jedd]